MIREKFLCFQFSHQCRMNWFFNCLFQMSDFSFSWNIFFDEKKKLAFKNNLSPFQLIFCVSVTIELFSWKLVEDRTTTTKLLEDNNRNRRWNKEITFDVYFLIFDVSPEKLSSKKPLIIKSLFVWKKKKRTAALFENESYWKRMKFWEA